MIITYNSRRFIFRECDVKGYAPAEIQALADKTGRMQYEPNHAWLVIPGIGYGMEEE